MNFIFHVFFSLIGKAPFLPSIKKNVRVRWKVVTADVFFSLSQEINGRAILIDARRTLNRNVCSTPLEEGVLLEVLIVAITVRILSPVLFRSGDFGCSIFELSEEDTFILQLLKEITDMTIFKLNLTIWATISSVKFLTILSLFNICFGKVFVPRS